MLVLSGIVDVAQGSKSKSNLERDGKTGSAGVRCGSLYGVEGGPRPEGGNLKEVRKDGSMQGRRMGDMLSTITAGKTVAWLPIITKHGREKR